MAANKSRTDHPAGKRTSVHSGEKNADIIPTAADTTGAHARLLDESANTMSAPAIQQRRLEHPAKPTDGTGNNGKEKPAHTRESDAADILSQGRDITRTGSFIFHDGKGQLHNLKVLRGRVFDNQEQLGIMTADGAVFFNKDKFQIGSKLNIQETYGAAFHSSTYNRNDIFYSKEKAEQSGKSSDNDKDVVDLNGEFRKANGELAYTCLHGYIFDEAGDFYGCITRVDRERETSGWGIQLPAERPANNLIGASQDGSHGYNDETWALNKLLNDCTFAGIEKSKDGDERPSSFKIDSGLVSGKSTIQGGLQSLLTGYNPDAAPVKYEISNNLVIGADKKIYGIAHMPTAYEDGSFGTDGYIAMLKPTGSDNRLRAVKSQDELRKLMEENPEDVLKKSLAGMTDSIFTWKHAGDTGKEGLPNSVQCMGDKRNADGTFATEPHKQGYVNIAELKLLLLNRAATAKDEKGTSQTAEVVRSQCKSKLDYLNNLLDNGRVKVEYGSHVAYDSYLSRGINPFSMEGFEQQVRKSTAANDADYERYLSTHVQQQNQLEKLPDDLSEIHSGQFTRTDKDGTIIKREIKDGKLYEPGSESPCEELFRTEDGKLAVRQLLFSGEPMDIVTDITEMDQAAFELNFTGEDKTPGKNNGKPVPVQAQWIVQEGMVHSVAMEKAKAEQICEHAENIAKLTEDEQDQKTRTELSEKLDLYKTALDSTFKTYSAGGAHESANKIHANFLTAGIKSFVPAEFAQAGKPSKTDPSFTTKALKVHENIESVKRNQPLEIQPVIKEVENRTSLPDDPSKIKDGWITLPYKDKNGEPIKRFIQNGKLYDVKFEFADLLNDPKKVEDPNSIQLTGEIVRLPDGKLAIKDTSFGARLELDLTKSSIVAGLFSVPVTPTMKINGPAIALNDVPNMFAHFEYEDANGKTIADDRLYMAGELELRKSELLQKADQEIERLEAQEKANPDFNKQVLYDAVGRHGKFTAAIDRVFRRESIETVAERQFLQDGPVRSIHPKDEQDAAKHIALPKLSSTAIHMVNGKLGLDDKIYEIRKGLLYRCHNDVAEKSPCGQLLPNYGVVFAANGNFNPTSTIEQKLNYRNLHKENNVLFKFSISPQSFAEANEADKYKVFSVGANTRLTASGQSMFMRGGLVEASEIAKETADLLAAAKASNFDYCKIALSTKGFADLVMGDRPLSDFLRQSIQSWSQAWGLSESNKFSEKTASTRQDLLNFLVKSIESHQSKIDIDRLFSDGLSGRADINKRSEMIAYTQALMETIGIQAADATKLAAEGEHMQSTINSGVSSGAVLLASLVSGGIIDKFAGGGAPAMLGAFGRGLSALARMPGSKLIGTVIVGGTVSAGMRRKGQGTLEEDIRHFGQGGLEALAFLIPGGRAKGIAELAAETPDLSTSVVGVIATGFRERAAILECAQAFARLPGMPMAIAGGKQVFRGTINNAAGVVGEAQPISEFWNWKAIAAGTFSEVGGTKIANGIFGKMHALGLISENSYAGKAIGEMAEEYCSGISDSIQPSMARLKREKGHVAFDELFFEVTQQAAWSAWSSLGVGLGSAHIERSHHKLAEKQHQEMIENMKKLELKVYKQYLGAMEEARNRNKATKGIDTDADRVGVNDILAKLPGVPEGKKRFFIVQDQSGPGLQQFGSLDAPDSAAIQKLFEKMNSAPAARQEILPQLMELAKKGQLHISAFEDSDQGRALLAHADNEHINYVDIDESDLGSFITQDGLAFVPFAMVLQRQQQHDPAVGQLVDAAQQDKDLASKNPDLTAKREAQSQFAQYRARVLDFIQQQNPSDKIDESHFDDAEKYIKEKLKNSTTLAQQVYQQYQNQLVAIDPIINWHDREQELAAALEPRRAGLETALNKAVPGSSIKIQFSSATSEPQYSHELGTIIIHPDNLAGDEADLVLTLAQAKEYAQQHRTLIAYFHQQALAKAAEGGRTLTPEQEIAAVQDLHKQLFNQETSKDLVESIIKDRKQLSPDELAAARRLEASYRRAQDDLPARQLTQEQTGIISQLAQLSQTLGAQQLFNIINASSQVVSWSQFAQALFNLPAAEAEQKLSQLRDTVAADTEKEPAQAKQIAETHWKPILDQRAQQLSAQQSAAQTRNNSYHHQKLATHVVQMVNDSAQKYLQQKANTQAENKTEQSPPVSVTANSSVLDTATPLISQAIANLHAVQVQLLKLREYRNTLDTQQPATQKQSNNTVTAQRPLLAPGAKRFLVILDTDKTQQIHAVGDLDEHELTQAQQLLDAVNKNATNKTQALTELLPLSGKGQLKVLALDTSTADPALLAQHSNAPYIDINADNAKDFVAENGLVSLPYELIIQKQLEELDKQEQAVQPRAVAQTGTNGNDLQRANTSTSLGQVKLETFTPEPLDFRPDPIDLSVVPKGAQPSRQNDSPESFEPSATMRAAWRRHGTLIAIDDRYEDALGAITNGNIGRAVELIVRSPSWPSMSKALGRSAAPIERKFNSGSRWGAARNKKLIADFKKALLSQQEDIRAETEQVYKQLEELFAAENKNIVDFIPNPPWVGVNATAQTGTQQAGTTTSPATANVLSIVGTNNQTPTTNRSKKNNKKSRSSNGTDAPNPILFSLDGANTGRDRSDGTARRNQPYNLQNYQQAATGPREYYERQADQVSSVESLNEELDSLINTDNIDSIQGLSDYAATVLDPRLAERAFEAILERQPPNETEILRRIAESNSPIAHRALWILAQDGDSQIQSILRIRIENGSIFKLWQDGRINTADLVSIYDLTALLEDLMQASTAYPDLKLDLANSIVKVNDDGGWAIIGIGRDERYRALRVLLDAKGRDYSHAIYKLLHHAGNPYDNESIDYLKRAWTTQEQNPPDQPSVNELLLGNRMERLATWTYPLLRDEHNELVSQLSKTAEELETKYDTDDQLTPDQAGTLMDQINEIHTQLHDILVARQTRATELINKFIASINKQDPNAKLTEEATVVQAFGLPIDGDCGATGGADGLMTFMPSYWLSADYPSRALAIAIGHELAHVRPQTDLMGRAIADQLNISGTVVEDSVKLDIINEYATATSGSQISIDYVEKMLVARNGQRLTDGQSLTADQFFQSTRMWNETIGFRRVEWFDRINRTKDLTKQWQNYYQNSSVDKFLLGDHPEDYIARAETMFGSPLPLEIAEPLQRLVAAHKQDEPPVILLENMSGLAQAVINLMDIGLTKLTLEKNAIERSYLALAHEKDARDVAERVAFFFDLNSQQQHQQAQQQQLQGKSAASHEAAEQTYFKELSNDQLNQDYIDLHTAIQTLQTVRDMLRTGETREAINELVSSNNWTERIKPGFRTDNEIVNAIDTIHKDSNFAFASLAAETDYAQKLASMLAAAQDKLRNLRQLAKHEFEARDLQAPQALSSAQNQQQLETTIIQTAESLIARGDCSSLDASDELGAPSFSEDIKHKILFTLLTKTESTSPSGQDAWRRIEKLLAEIARMVASKYSLRQQADELVQDAAVRLLRVFADGQFNLRESLDNNQRVWSYLNTIVNSCAIDRLRAQGRNHRRTVPLDIDVPSANSGKNVEDRENKLKAIRTGLEELEHETMRPINPQSFAAFKLVYGIIAPIQDNTQGGTAKNSRRIASYAEIARQLGFTSASAAKQAIHLVRTKLRSRLHSYRSFTRAAITNGRTPTRNRQHQQIQQQQLQEQSGVTLEMPASTLGESALGTEPAQKYRTCVEDRKLIENSLRALKERQALGTYAVMGQLIAAKGEDTLLGLAKPNTAMVELIEKYQAVDSDPINERWPSNEEKLETIISNFLENEWTKINKAEYSAAASDLEHQRTTLQNASEFVANDVQQAINQLVSNQDWNDTLKPLLAQVDNELVEEIERRHQQPELYGQENEITFIAGLEQLLGIAQSEVTNQQLWLFDQFDRLNVNRPILTASPPPSISPSTGPESVSTSSLIEALRSTRPFSAVPSKSQHQHSRESGFWSEQNQTDTRRKTGAPTSADISNVSQNLESILKERQLLKQRLESTKSALQTLESQRRLRDRWKNRKTKRNLDSALTDTQNALAKLIEDQTDIALTTVDQSEHAAVAAFIRGNNNGLEILTKEIIRGVRGQQLTSAHLQEVSRLADQLSGYDSRPMQRLLGLGPAISVSALNNAIGNDALSGRRAALAAKEVLRGASAEQLNNSHRLHALDNLVNLFGGYYSPGIKQLLQLEPAVSLIDISAFVGSDTSRADFINQTILLDATGAGLSHFENLEAEYESHLELGGPKPAFDRSARKLVIDRVSSWARQRGQQINLASNTVRTYAQIDQLINHFIAERMEILSRPQSKTDRQRTQINLTAAQELKRRLKEAISNPSTTPTSVFNDFVNQSTIQPTPTSPQGTNQQQNQPQLNGPPSYTHNDTDSTQPPIELTQKAKTLSDDERRRVWEAQQRGQGQDAFANDQYSDHGIPTVSQAASTANSASSNSVAPGAAQQQLQQQQQSGGTPKDSKDKSFELQGKKGNNSSRDTVERGSEQPVNVGKVNWAVSDTPDEAEVQMLVEAFTPLAKELSDLQFMASMRKPMEIYRVIQKQIAAVRTALQRRGVPLDQMSSTYHVYTDEPTVIRMLELVSRCNMALEETAPERERMELRATDVLNEILDAYDMPYAELGIDRLSRDHAFGTHALGTSVINLLGLSFMEDTEEEQKENDYKLLALSFMKKTDEGQEENDYKYRVKILIEEFIHYRQTLVCVAFQIEESIGNLEENRILEEAEIDKICQDFARENPNSKLSRELVIEVKAKRAATPLRAGKPLLDEERAFGLAMRKAKQDHAAVQLRLTRSQEQVRLVNEIFDLPKEKGILAEVLLLANHLGIEQILTGGSGQKIIQLVDKCKQIGLENIDALNRAEEEQSLPASSRTIDPQRLFLDVPELEALYEEMYQTFSSLMEEWDSEVELEQKAAHAAYRNQFHELNASHVTELADKIMLEKERQASLIVHAGTRYKMFLATHRSLTTQLEDKRKERARLMRSQGFIARMANQVLGIMTPELRDLNSAISQLNTQLHENSAQSWQAEQKEPTSGFVFGGKSLPADSIITVGRATESPNHIAIGSDVSVPGTVKNQHFALHIGENGNTITIEAIQAGLSVIRGKDTYNIDYNRDETFALQPGDIINFGGQSIAISGQKLGKQEQRDGGGIAGGLGERTSFNSSVPSEDGGPVVNPSDHAISSQTDRASRRDASPPTTMEGLRSEVEQLAKERQQFRAALPADVTESVETWNLTLDICDNLRDRMGLINGEINETYKPWKTQIERLSARLRAFDYAILASMRFIERAFGWIHLPRWIKQ